MATQNNDSGSDESDVYTEDVEHPIEAGQGEHLVLEPAAQEQIKGRNRHIFVPDDKGGYSAICGNKNSPQHLAGKHLKAADRFEIILHPTPLCKSCQKKTGMNLGHLNLDELREFARNDYDSTFVIPADEALNRMRDDRIPVRMSASLEIDLPRSTEDKLLEVLERAPHLLDRIQGIDAERDEIILKSIETKRAED